MTLGWPWWRAWAPLVARAWRRGTLRGGRGTWRHRRSICVAGVALGDIDVSFAWHLVTSTLQVSPSLSNKTLSQTILSHTVFHTYLSHMQLSRTQLCQTQLFCTHTHTHLSHTQLCHTQLYHTPSFTHTHTSLSHATSLSHPSLSHTTLSNTIFHTHTHNFVTNSHNLSHAALSQTTLSHTTLSHTTLSPTIFHTQLWHTHTKPFRHTTLSPTIFHTQLWHTHTQNLSDTQLCHTQSFTHNFVTLNSAHTTFKIIDPPPSPLSFLLSQCGFNHFFWLLEEIDLWGYPVLHFFKPLVREYLPRNLAISGGAHLGVLSTKTSSGC